MADKINGYGRVGPDIGSGRSRAATRADSPGGTGATHQARDTAAVADAVQLTDTASRLKKIEAHLAKLSDVDQARVDALRKRIESGDYRPDPQRIAAKLVRMEQDLG